MSTTDVKDPKTIHATLLPGTSEAGHLPALFGGGVLRFIEPFTLYWMQSLASDFNGSSWSYYSLSNGGFYMAPEKSGEYRVSVHGNYFNDRLSADAAGIVATMFALGELAAMTEHDHIIELYHSLRYFACEHDESRLILAAID